MDVTGSEGSDLLEGERGLCFANDARMGCWPAFEAEEVDAIGRRQCALKEAFGIHQFWSVGIGATAWRAMAARNFPVRRLRATICSYRWWIPPTCGNAKSRAFIRRIVGKLQRAPKQVSPREPESCNNQVSG
jgi:hypothetical protein